MSAAVHDQPSEDVDDQVPPLQAYRDQTSTVVPFHVRVARTGPLPLALQSASVSESLMMTSSYGTGYVVNTDDIMGGGM